jgi:hypothetical protein
VLHHITDTNEAADIVQRLKGALPVGGYLAISHASNAVNGWQSEQAAAYWNTHGTPPISLRSPEQIIGFFDGMELVEPGAVSCSLGKKVAP